MVHDGIASIIIKGVFSLRLSRSDWFCTLRSWNSFFTLFPFFFSFFFSFFLFVFFQYTQFFSLCEPLGNSLGRAPDILTFSLTLELESISKNNEQLVRSNKVGTQQLRQPFSASCRANQHKTIVTVWRVRSQQQQHQHRATETSETILSALW